MWFGMFTVFTILDAVYCTSVRVARTIHRTVWSMISFGAKEPGCESHTKIVKSVKRMIKERGAVNELHY